jgi:uncharacterized protein (DUF4213/DUF364 family)
MSSTHRPGILEQTRARFREIAGESGLLEARVSVLARPLTPEEAIGTPGRRDFPIILGKERILEASFLGARGHAFTDAAREFLGTVAEVLDLELTSNQSRAIFIATLNAVLRHLGRAGATVHCRDDDPETCGAEIARRIHERSPGAAVGLIGLNPAIAEHLVRVFGPDRVRLTDLYQGNIGKERFGVQVWDGEDRTADLVGKSDIILISGTTLQNATFDAILAAIRAQGRTGIVYGVTGAGVCALTGIERLCPCGRDL